VNDVVVVLCTAPAAAPPGARSAEDLARAVVDEGLAACVNLLPGVRSVFRWEGKVDAADEVLLVAKTTADAADRLCRRLGELHSYSVPELLVLPVAGGSEPYLDWLRQSVVKAAPPRGGGG
jgi:periplasmic divalent cation tolerance protein